MIKYTKTVYSYNFTAPTNITETQYDEYKQSYADPYMKPQEDSGLKQVAFGVLKVVFFPFAVLSGAYESSKNLTEWAKDKEEFESDLKSMILKSHNYEGFIREYRMEYDCNYKVEYMIKSLNNEFLRKK